MSDEQLRLSKKQDSSTAYLDTMAKVLLELREENKKLEQQNLAIQALLNETYEQGNLLFSQNQTAGRGYFNNFSRTIDDAFIWLNRCVEVLRPLNCPVVHINDSDAFFTFRRLLESLNNVISDELLAYNPHIVSDDTNNIVANNFKDCILNIHDDFFSNNEDNYANFLAYTQKSKNKRKEMLQYFAASSLDFLTIFSRYFPQRNIRMLEENLGDLQNNYTAEESVYFNDNAVGDDCPTIAATGLFAPLYNKIHCKGQSELYVTDDSIINTIIYFHNTSERTAKNVKIKLRMTSYDTANKVIFNATISANNAYPASGQTTVFLPSSKHLTFGTLYIYLDQSLVGTRLENGDDIFTNEGLLLPTIAGIKDCEIDSNLRNVFCHQGWLFLSFRVDGK